jgi:hypothetical protein
MYVPSNKIWMSDVGFDSQYVQVSQRSYTFFVRPIGEFATRVFPYFPWSRTHLTLHRGETCDASIKGSTSPLGVSPNCNLVLDGDTAGLLWGVVDVTRGLLKSQIKAKTSRYDLNNSLRTGLGGSWESSRWGQWIKKADLIKSQNCLLCLLTTRNMI